MIRYRFPTHTNDLIMDRRDAAASEAFFVILEPGEAPPLHVHEDAEQVFFVLEGEGALTIGRDDIRRRSDVASATSSGRRPGPTTRSAAPAPSGSSTSASTASPAGPPAAEPTWDSHVRAMCQLNGWDFDAVRLGPVDPATRPPAPSTGRILIDRHLTAQSIDREARP